MDQSSNVFPYGPLANDPQELRLVLIDPGQSSSPMRCSLKHVVFKDKPPFEALSYVWGDPKDVVPIYLEGRIFNVTINLASALQHLRLEDAVRVFWIDAICINQLDMQERAQQVQLMGEIFGTATRTTVWLGPETEYSALAFEYIVEQAQVGYCVKLRTFENKSLRQIIRRKDIRHCGLKMDVRASRSDVTSEGNPDDAQGDTKGLSMARGSTKNLITNPKSDTWLKERKTLLDDLDKTLDKWERIGAEVRQAAERSYEKIKEIRQEMETRGSRHVRASRKARPNTPRDLEVEGTQNRETQKHLSRQRTTSAAGFHGFGTHVPSTVIPPSMNKPRADDSAYDGHNGGGTEIQCHP